MKKSSSICFINLDSINVTPYFAQYRKCLRSDYDLIYWDRGKHDCATGAKNSFRYKSAAPSNSTSNLMTLAKGYLGFRRFATRILRQDNYQRVVALTGNCAVLLSPILCKKYSGRFIIDIRDYFLEDFRPYRWVEEKTIDASGLAVISSPAYEHFLGHHNFQVMHNVQEISPAELQPIKQKNRPSHPMVLASIGTAKNLELDKNVIQYFANDHRFLLKFYGRGYDQLESFCSSNGITNVQIRGDFSANQTVSFYQDVDAIISMYGSSQTHFKYQLTNKLYYALQLGLPIIVSPGSFMAHVTEKYSLGHALNLSDNSEKNAILSLFDNPAAAARLSGQRSFMEIVHRDNDAAMQKISDFLNV